MVQTLMWFQGIVSLLMIVLVLLQFGKGAEAGLLSAGDSVMSGSQKGNILSKATVVLSIFFFANSVYLAKVQSQKTEKSLLDSEAPVAQPFNNDAAREEAKAKAEAEAGTEAVKSEEAAPADDAAQTEPAPGSPADTTEPAPAEKP